MTTSKLQDIILELDYIISDLQDIGGGWVDLDKEEDEETRAKIETAVRAVDALQRGKIELREMKRLEDTIYSTD